MLKNYRKISPLIILSFCCCFYSLAIQAKTVVVPLITNKVNKDAYFHNNIWKKAVVFTQFTSKEGAIPTVRTKLYLMYDKYNLYVGFECLDQSPQNLVANSRYLPNGDAVALALDTFHDGLAAYVFASNPKGNKLTGVLSDYSSGLRFAFFANYTVISKLTSAGYNAEMIIPFASFPYKWQKYKTSMGFRAVRITRCAPWRAESEGA